jgi:hypothetical protein
MLFFVGLTSALIGWESHLVWPSAIDGRTTYFSFSSAPAAVEQMENCPSTIFNSSR